MNDDLVYDDGIAKRCSIKTRPQGEGHHLYDPPNPFTSKDLPEDHCWSARIGFTLTNGREATFDTALNSFAYAEPNESGLHTIALVSNLRQAYLLIDQPLAGDEWEAAQDIVNIDDEKEQKQVLNFCYAAWSEMYIPMTSRTRLIDSILPVVGRGGTRTARPPVALAYLPAEREVSAGTYRTYRNIRFFADADGNVQFEDDDVVQFVS